MTLRLDEAVIQKAKRYARENQTSLSDMVENYFKKITDQRQSTEEIAPIIRELTGIMHNSKARANYKTEIAEYLAEKHK